MTDSELLDVAVRVIGARGPAGFTLAHVASAARLSSSTLIQRFGSKELLLERAIAHASSRLEAAVVSIPVPSVDPRGALLEWLVALARPLRTRQLVAAHLPILQRDMLDRRARRAAQRHSQLLRQRIHQYLCAIPPRAPGADAAAAAQSLEAQWHGLVIQWALGGSGSQGTWVRSGLERALRAVW